MPASSKPKPLRYKILKYTGETDDSQLPYIMMKNLVAQYHDPLIEAHIAIAFSHGWKPDRDRKITLGMAKISGELDRQLHTFDIVIILNYDFWHHPDTRYEHQLALVDHELCHPRPVMDDQLGMPKRDEDGKIVYYNRKHDIEDFKEIFQRHGLWKSDLEETAQIMSDALEAHKKNNRVVNDDNVENYLSGGSDPDLVGQASGDLDDGEDIVTTGVLCDE
jgi:hypothetical protein